MPRFKIHHVTKYTYEAPVRDSANQILLFPIKDEHQQVLKQDLFISGEPGVDIFKDYYGNDVGTFMKAVPHTELVIDSKIEVVTRARPFPDDEVSKEKQWGELSNIKYTVPYIDYLKQEIFAAIEDVRHIANVPQYHTNYTVCQSAKFLTEYVFINFSYIKGVTTVESTLDEVWRLKAGVCQDFAHILLVMLRMLGIPSRYVSGYICPNRNGMRGEGATHAWVEAYIPFYGWLGFDPTNNCMVNDLHVRLAVGRNFSDCSPVRGTYKGTSNQQLEVGVSVAYEDGHVQDDVAAVLKPHPVTVNAPDTNSYRRYMEMMQQQQ
ncbi:MAG: transglutaminase family protein [Sphingobacteriales bacterium]|nr:MAG: transglutaminase family protein [Sphingobacteriales bacterium]